MRAGGPWPVRALLALAAVTRVRTTLARHACGQPGRNYVATFSNPTMVAGQRARALDAANAEVAKLRAGATFMAWLRFDNFQSGGGSRTHFSLSRSSQCCHFNPFLGTRGHMLFGRDFPLKQSAGSLPRGYGYEWHHYALTWNASDGLVRVYLDGVGEDLGHVHGSLVDDRPFVSLGVHPYPQNVDTAGAPLEVNDLYVFRGQMDDVALFGGALSADGVRERWNASLTDRLRAGLEPDLLLFYNFDEPLEPLAAAGGEGGGGNRTAGSDEGSGAQSGSWVNASLSAVEPNLGTIGADADLIFGEVVHADQRLRRLYRPSRLEESHVVGLTPPERTAPPHSVGWAHAPPPAAGAPLVACARAGETLTLTLEGGRALNFSAPDPFSAPVRLLRGGGGAADAHVWPLGAPAALQLGGGAEVHLQSTQREGTAHVLELLGSGGALGQTVQPVITRLPARGTLHELPPDALAPAGAAGADTHARSFVDAAAAWGRPIVTPGHALTPHALRALYTPPPHAHGEPYDSLGFALRLADGAELESEARNFTVAITPVDQLPSVCPRRLELDEDSSGEAVELSAQNPEEEDPTGLFVERLPAKGELHFDEPGRGRVRVRAAHNAFAVGQVLAQYLHEITAVSSFWGDGVQADYHPVQAVGPPTCATWGECWGAFEGGVPQPGELVHHPPHDEGGPLARVRAVHGSGADAAVEIEYLPQWRLDALTSEWRPCEMQISAGAATAGADGGWGGRWRYPEDCRFVRDSPAERRESTVRARHLSPTVAGSWSPARRTFVGAERLSAPGGGRYGPQFAFSYSQAETYPRAGYTEYIEGRVLTPVYVVSVELGQPRGMGSVVGVKARGEDTGWRTLYRQPAQQTVSRLVSRAGQYWAWEVPLCRTHFKATHIRIEMDSSAETGISDWNYLDYVKVIGSTELQSGALPFGVRAVTYTPHKNEHGEDSFSYSATDCPGRSLRSAEPASVSVHIRAANDSPTARAVEATLTAGEVGKLALDVEDVDSAGAALTCTLEGARAEADGGGGGGADAPPARLFASRDDAEQDMHELELPSSLGLGATAVWVRALAPGRLWLNYSVADSHGARSERAAASVLVRVDEERARRERELIITVLSCTVGVVFVLLALWCCCRTASAVRSALDAQRAHDDAGVGRVLGALASVVEIKCSVVLVPFSTLKELGALRPHEELRARAELVYLDTYDQLMDFVAEHQSVFISHQWLGYEQPDPEGEQYDAVLSVCDALCEWHGLRSEELYVWIDYLSIPQRNATAKQNAIDTLATCSSAMGHFVVIAPRATHADSGAACDASTYRQRGWCRLEQWARLALGGADGMYLWEGVQPGLSASASVQPLAQRAGWLDEVLYVFEGDFTDAKDKRSIVDACIGISILARLQQLATPGLEPSPGEAARMAALETDRARIFPPEFFENLIDIADMAVEALGQDVARRQTAAAPVEVLVTRTSAARPDEPATSRLSRAASSRDARPSASPESRRRPSSHDSRCSSPPRLRPMRSSFLGGDTDPSGSRRTMRQSARYTGDSLLRTMQSVTGTHPEQRRTSPPRGGAAARGRIHDPTRYLSQSAHAAILERLETSGGAQTDSRRGSRRPSITGLRKTSRLLLRSSMQQRPRTASGTMSNRQSSGFNGSRSSTATGTPLAQGFRKASIAVLPDERCDSDVDDRDSPARGGSGAPPAGLVSGLSGRSSSGGGCGACSAASMATTAPPGSGGRQQQGNAPAAACRWGDGRAMPAVVLPPISTADEATTGSTTA